MYHRARSNDIMTLLYRLSIVELYNLLKKIKVTHYIKIEDDNNSHNNISNNIMTII